MIIDPIGDLLTRIRNGQMRHLAKIKSPNSRLRVRLLDVLQEEGFIRGYAEVETKGHKELEIELKYHEGEPVIRELKRISTPGRRVYSSVSELKPHRQGLGVSILSTPQGPDDGQQPPRKRMSAAKFSARCFKEPVDVPYRQESRRSSQRRHRLGGRPDRQGQGPQGRTQRQAGAGSLRLGGRARHHRHARQGARARRADVGPVAQPGQQSGRPASPPASPRSWKSRASAIAPRCRARTSTCSSAFQP